MWEEELVDPPNEYIKISNVIDWMFVPCLSLISFSSYVAQGTKETGNICSNLTISWFYQNPACFLYPNATKNGHMKKKLQNFNNI